MPTTTIENVRIDQLTPAFWRKHNITPQKPITIIVEDETDDLGEALLQGFKEVKAHIKGEIELPNARDVFKS